MNIQYFRSKIVICLIALTCLYLFASPIWAQTECLDDLYYFDQTYQKCVHKHGGYFEPTINQCVYNFSAVDDCLCNINCPSPIVSPSVTPTISSPSASPTLTQASSSAKVETIDEKALAQRGKVLLPREIEQAIEPADQNLFTVIGGLFSKLLTSLFGFQPASPQTFSSRASVQHQTELPTGLINTGNVGIQTATQLGGASGLYSADAPKEIQQGLETVRDFENLYDQKSFPQTVRIFPTP